MANAINLDDPDEIDRAITVDPSFAVSHPKGGAINFNDPDAIDRAIITDPSLATTPKPKNPMGSLESGVRGIGQGLFFNYEPTVAGALAASGMAEAGAYNPELGFTPEMMNKTRQDIQSSETEANKRAHEQHPYWYTAGQVAGSVPSTALVPGPTAGAGFMANAARAAPASAALGAAYGSGEGDTAEERVRNALIGGVTGGILGGAGTGIGGKFLPKEPAVAGKEISEAAKNLGIEMPMFATTDSLPVQMASQGLKSVPFAGAPLIQASEKATQQMGSRLGDIAELAGGLTTEEAGQQLGTSLSSWIRDASKKTVGDAYSAVSAKLDPAITTALDNTKNIIQDISKNRSVAGLPESPVASLLQEAVNRPGGLSYDGIKYLRTYIGEMLENQNLLPADVKGSELKQVYSALSGDLRKSVENSGGADALTAFEKANSLNAEISNQREALVRLLGGPNASKSNEAVLGSLQRIAGKTAGANAELLRRTRAVVPDNEWQAATSGIIHGMGYDTHDVFSPARFRTAYNKLSDVGKDTLFGKAGNPIRDQLENMSTLSTGMTRLSPFANPSGTAHSMSYMSLPAALFHAPITTLSSIFGGRIITSIISKPEGSSVMMNFGRALASGSEDAVKAAAQSLSTTLATETGKTIGADKLIDMAREQAQKTMRPTEPTHRATGGKVGNGASKLMRLAEHAKRAETGQTESILKVPDEAVVKALDVAKQAI